MNLFSQFMKSLYSPKDIVKFRFQGIGKTILYVFMLMFLTTLPGLYQFSKMSITALNDGKQIFMKELPPFTIENGVLSSEQNKPIELNKQDFTLIFDPSGDIDTTDLEDGRTVFGLLKNEFVIVAEGQSQTFPYSALAEMKVTNKEIDQFLQSIHGILWVLLPILFIIYYLFVAGSGFIKISIFAGIGVLFAGTLGRRLQYRQSWRIAAYSITLSTVFFIFMDSLKTGVPGGMFIDWFVSLLFLYLSIREIPKPKKIQQ